MPRSITIAGGMMAIVMLLGVAMMPVTLVTVTVGDGRAIVCERVDRESSIALTFTHSMYGGDVTEFYEPGPDGRLVRAQILTGNAAAAEYYAWDGAIRESGERYEVVVPDQAFGSLAIMADAIGHHRLDVDGTEYGLAVMVDGPSPVELALVTRPLFTQVFGGRC
jgi:hypothetical protein